jgi:CheY-like chemotaxis protein
VTLPLHYDTAPLVTRVATIPSREESISPPESDKIILAIDDDPDVIYLLRENLTEAGYRVVGATSAEEGLQQARALHPLAITLDILMPHKDGWQLLHELKTDATTRDIPIIVLSIVDNKALGYQLGAFDYLLKPFDREAILSLPVIDGWKATRRIKANAALCAIPIIALSAHAMTGDEERALQSGCNDYLSKPLDEDLLFAKLAKFLGQE